MVKKMGLDYAYNRTLCSQLLLYKNKVFLFNQGFTEGMDNPYTWWSSIEPEPKHLQDFAMTLFSICPNSASCERGFSICGWITNKRRLRLGVERLESMLKLITYYRSNALAELGFFGKGDKPNSLDLSEDNINSIVNEALVEVDDDDDDDDEAEIQRTIDGDIIPNHEIIIWIENTLELSNQRIIRELGEIPDDDLDDDNSCLNEIGKETEEEEEVEGRGVMDYNIKDLCDEFAIE
jgi:hypothetical protein